MKYELHAPVNNEALFIFCESVFDVVRRNESTAQQDMAQATFASQVFQEMLEQEKKSQEISSQTKIGIRGIASVLHQILVRRGVDSPLGYSGRPTIQ